MIEMCWFQFLKKTLFKRRQWPRLVFRKWNGCRKWRSMLRTKPKHFQYNRDQVHSLRSQRINFTLWVRRIVRDAQQFKVAHSFQPLCQGGRRNVFIIVNQNRIKGSLVTKNNISKNDHWPMVCNHLGSWGNCTMVFGLRRYVWFDHLIHNFSL